MKWAYLVKYKIKAALALFIIMAIILFSNIYERRNFDVLDKNISTIYADRLMPATYIYQLTHQLYKKRLLKEHYTEYASVAFYQKKSTYDSAISKLIADYESTYLTKDEKAHWQQLKHSLFNYNNQYDNSLAGLRSKVYNAGTNDVQLTAYFDEVMQHLDALSLIQTGVGKHIETNSRAVISSSILPSYLENTLLIVLGIICITLLSVTDKNIFPKYQHGSLN